MSKGSSVDSGDGAIRKPVKPVRERLPHGKRYPWDEWFEKAREGKGIVLVKGRDYDCLTHGMQQMIRNRAGMDSVRLSVGVYMLDEDRLRVKVYGELGDKGENPKGRRKGTRNRLRTRG